MCFLPSKDPSFTAKRNKKPCYVLIYHFPFDWNQSEVESQRMQKRVIRMRNLINSAKLNPVGVRDS